MADSSELTGHVPEPVAEMLNGLVAGAKEALGEDLVGIYLRGSLATGDFDPTTSDIDFFAVTERPVSEAQFALLSKMHSRLGSLPNRYANELEGAYLSRDAARRYRPNERHPTIYRGEALKWGEHHTNWLLERSVVWSQGITLVGPDPTTLFDPISEREIREAVADRLEDWAEWAREPDDPEWLLPVSHMAYVIETTCRALYSLAHGELASKPRAVAWGLSTLPEPWRSMVERSQTWRSEDRSDPNAFPQVRDFVFWAASQGTKAVPKA